MIEIAQMTNGAHPSRWIGVWNGALSDFGGSQARNAICVSLRACLLGLSVPF